MRRRPARWLRSGLIRWHVWRCDRVESRRKRYARLAFDNAESRYASLPSEVVLALRAQAHELAPLKLTDQDSRQLSGLDWRSACDPWDLARYDDAREAAKEYPERSRILPTRLGNVLRASEDYVVKVTGEDLETFALRRRAWLEPRVQLQHDQFRTRLDMYCTLVFVALALAVTTVLLTIGQEALRIPFFVIAAGFVTVGLAAYQAAVASARGYCTILRLMASLPKPGGTEKSS
jgi:hypothetical protein